MKNILSNIVIVSILASTQAFAFKWTIQGDYNYDPNKNPKYYHGEDFSVNMDLQPFKEKDGSTSPHDFFLKSLDKDANGKKADEILSRAFALDDMGSNRFIASALAELKCSPKKLEVITEIKSVPIARADVNNPKHPGKHDSRRAVSIEFKGCVNPPDEMPDECAVTGDGEGYIGLQFLRKAIKGCNEKLKAYAPIKQQFFPEWKPH